MTSYTKENLLPTLIAEGITLDETKKQFETALSILRNEEKILIEALTRLKRDEQFQQSKNRHKNRNRTNYLSLAIDGNKERYVDENINPLSISIDAAHPIFFSLEISNNFCGVPSGLE